MEAYILIELRWVALLQDRLLRLSRIEDGVLNYELIQVDEGLLLSDTSLTLIVAQHTVVCFVKGLNSRLKGLNIGERSLQVE